MRQHISSSPGEPPPPARPVQPTRPPHFATLGKIALLFVVASVAYLPSINGGFIFDDDLLLTDNALIQAPDGLLRFWYSTQQPDYVPLTCSTLWFEWRLWGMNSTGYHVTNLLLHIAACLLIWVLLQKLSIPGGFLAALLFAIHPVNVESVAWVEQRKNTLSILFLLLSICWYLKSDVQSPSPDLSSRRGVSLWYFMSLLAFALAVFSKGSVAILPLLLLLIVWWQRGRIAMRDLLRTMPFFLLAAALTPVILWFVTRGTGGTVRDATFVERLLGAGTIVWFYLSKGTGAHRAALCLPPMANSISRSTVVAAAGGRCDRYRCARAPTPSAAGNCPAIIIRLGILLRGIAPRVGFYRPGLYEVLACGQPLSAHRTD